MMVAMNADPSSIPELIGRPGQGSNGHEGSTRLQLIPTPTEQFALGMPPGDMTGRSFSQAIYTHAVRECFDAESQRPEERDPNEIQRLMSIKDGWLRILTTPEEQREAVLSAYSFHIGESHTQEQKAA
jgi:hypothetical protein